MSGQQSQRIPIRFDRWYAVLSSVLGLPPSTSYVEVTDDQVHVRMGWAFRATFPKSTLASTEIANQNPLSRGVHGFAGRWLVNGSGQGILSITLNPVQRCHVLGVPVRLQQLMVSVPDPGVLAALLETSGK
jgi:hypothetical protein